MSEHNPTNTRHNEPKRLRYANIVMSPKSLLFRRTSNAKECLWASVTARERLPVNGVGSHKFTIFSSPQCIVLRHLHCDLMAPLHHHNECRNWRQHQCTGNFQGTLDFAFTSNVASSKSTSHNSHTKLVAFWRYKCSFTHHPSLKEMLAAVLHSN